MMGATFVCCAKTKFNCRHRKIKFMMSGQNSQSPFPYQLVCPGLPSEAGNGDHMPALLLQHVRQEGLQHADDEENDDEKNQQNIQTDSRMLLMFSTLIVQKCASTFTSKFLTILKVRIW